VAVFLTVDCQVMVIMEEASVTDSPVNPATRDVITILGQAMPSRDCAISAFPKLACDR
jgi:hypothetical protein